MNILPRSNVHSNAFVRGFCQLCLCSVKSISHWRQRCHREQRIFAHDLEFLVDHTTSTVDSESNVTGEAEMQHVTGILGILCVLLSSSSSQRTKVMSGVKLSMSSTEVKWRRFRKYSNNNILVLSRRPCTWWLPGIRLEKSLKYVELALK